MTHLSPTRILSAGLFVLLPLLAACSTETDMMSPDTSSGASVSVSSIAETGVGPYVAVSFPANQLHMQEIWDKPRFTIRGTASGIDVITVRSSCDGLAHKLQKFTPGDSEWSYTVDATYGNLCASKNTYLITGFQKNAAEDTKVDETVVEISSQAGPRSMKDFPIMNRILELAKRGIASPVADVSIPTSIAFNLEKDAAAKELCTQHMAGKTLPAPSYFLPITSVTSSLSMGVRTGLQDDMFSRSFGGAYAISKARKISNTSNEQGVGTPLIFLYEQRENRLHQLAGIPGIARFDCEFGGSLRVRAPQEDRVFIEVQDGWSAIPDVLLYDGKTMRPAQQLVREALGGRDDTLPLEGLVLTIGTTTFSLREAFYCCDVPTTVIGGKFVEYIFDMETLELVGTVIRDQQRS